MEDGQHQEFCVWLFFLLYSRHASACPVILFLNSEDIHATALPGWKTFYTTCSMLPSALWKKGHNQRLHWRCVIFPHNRELIQKTRHIDLRSLLFSFMAKISLGHKRATQYFQDQEERENTCRGDHDGAAARKAGSGLAPQLPCQLQVPATSTGKGAPGATSAAFSVGPSRASSAPTGLSFV